MANKEKMAIKETYSELAISFKESRSPQVFGKLYTKMYPNILNYVFGILKDIDVSRDVVSDTMVSLYTKIDQYDPSFQITTWAYKIAYNNAIRVIRERNCKVSLNTSYVDAVDGVEFEMNNKQKSISDLMHYDENEFLKKEEEYTKKDDILQEDYDNLLKEIGNLKPMYKEIMTYRFLDHLSYDEIVEKLNSPFIKSYEQLQEITLRVKLEWENDRSNLDKKHTFDKVRNIRNDFEKKNMVNLQTIKNRIRRSRLILFERLKESSSFLIYKLKEFDDD